MPPLPAAFRRPAASQRTGTPSCQQLNRSSDTTRRRPCAQTRPASVRRSEGPKLSRKCMFERGPPDSFDCAFLHVGAPLNLRHRGTPDPCPPAKELEHLPRASGRREEHTRCDPKSVDGWHLMNRTPDLSRRHPKAGTIERCRPPHESLRSVWRHEGDVAANRNVAQRH